MNQYDLNAVVAGGAGDALSDSDHVRFVPPDALDSHDDSTPRAPLVLDWDSMSAAEWPMI